MAPPDHAPETGEQRPARGWLRVALVLGLALAVVAAFRALLPLGLERTLEGRLSEALGRPVRVENVDLALFRGGVALEGIGIGAPGADAVPDPESEGPFLLRAEHLFVRFSWTDLLRRRIRLREVASNGGSLRLVQRADGSLEPWARPSEEAEAEPDASGRSWPIRVDRVTLRNTQVRLEAADGSTPLELRVPRLALTDLVPAPEALSAGALEVTAPILRVSRDWTPASEEAAEEAAEAATSSAATPVRIGRVTIEAGRIGLQGGPEPFEATFDLTATELSTRPDARFELELGVGVEEGSARLAGQASLVPVAFEGTLGLRDLPLAPVVRAATRDENGPLRAGRASGELALVFGGTDGAALDSVRANGRFALDAMALADGGRFGLGWKRLEADVAEARIPLGPGAARFALDRVRIELPSLRWVRSADEAAAEAEPAGSEAAPGLEVVIAQLELVDGSLDFEDRAVEPPFRARAAQVTASAQAVGWPDLRASELRAQARVFENGSLALRGGLEGAPTGRFRVEVAGMGLEPLNPYVTPVGYRFEGGVLTLDSKLRIRGERIESSNDVRLRRLAVSGSGNGWLERNVGISLDLALALLRDPQGGIRLDLPVSWETGRSGTGFRRALQSAFRQALVGALSTPLKLVGAVFSVRGSEVIRFDAIEAAVGGTDLTEPGEVRLAALASLLETRPQLGARLRGRTGPADRLALAGDGGADAVDSDRLEALAKTRAEHVRGLLTARGIGERRLEIGSPAPPGGPGVGVEFFAVES